MTVERNNIIPIFVLGIKVRSYVFQCFLNCGETSTFTIVRTPIRTVLCYDQELIVS